MKASRVQSLIVLSISLALPVCGAYGQKPKDEGERITVTTVQSKAVTITQQYVGQIHSQRHIEVRAPAEGYIATIPIKMGQAVKTGDVLFQIGPVIYKARLDAEAAENLAQLELSFTKKLLEQNVVNPDEVKLLEAKLAKSQAKMDLAAAELNFTTVRAPFDGLVGRLSRQQGSFVLKGEILTTLSDNSVVQVDFYVPEARYLEYMAESGKNRQSPAIELDLRNGKTFDQSGKIDAIETEFHGEHITFRAEFPNPDRLLRHGQTGTVLINRVLKDAVVVPQRATLEVLNKRYVYVVDKDRSAHRREIVIENEVDDQFVIKTGVGAGDKIVLEGVRQVHEGDKVE